MRTMISSLLLGAAGMLFSPSSEASASSPAAAPVAAPAAPVADSLGVRFHVGSRRFGVSFGVRSSSRSRSFRSQRVYRPRYRLERVWVAPVYETRVVGYDHHGRPIYDRVCARAGYWRTVRVRVSRCHW